MNEDDLTPEEDRFDQLMMPAVRRLVWSKNHIARFEEAYWEANEGYAPAEFYGESDENIYPLLIRNLLYTATRTSHGAIALLGEPLGSNPVEQLLRGTLLASAKAIYLLAPEESSQRVKWIEEIYSGDRHQYEMALWTQNVQDGSTESRPKGKPVVSDTKMINIALDYLVERDDELCESSRVSLNELEEIRTRLKLWWSLYSAVIHANIWQIESSAQLAPTGLTHTTGDLSQAFYDISWLKMEATRLCLQRFKLLHLVEVL